MRTSYVLALCLLFPYDGSSYTFFSFLFLPVDLQSIDLRLHFILFHMGVDNKTNQPPNPLIHLLQLAKEIGSLCTSTCLNEFSSVHVYKISSLLIQKYYCPNILFNSWLKSAIYQIPP